MYKQIPFLAIACGALIITAGCQEEPKKIVIKEEQVVVEPIEIALNEEISEASMPSINDTDIEKV